jgi:hypothetical protein
MMMAMLNGTYTQSDPKPNGRNPREQTRRSPERALERPFNRLAPHNLEAEQALLGAMLVNNEAHDRVSSFLEPDHFYDPLHKQIYETASKLIASGKRADPITLKTFFESAEPIDANLTVPQYLGTLAANATTVINARDYGRTIHDLATRRQLILIGEDLVNAAYDAPIDFPPAEQMCEGLARLEKLTQAEPSQLVPITLDRFLSLELKTAEWVVEDLLQQRSIAMVYAWRGLGKTWFALGLAYAIAAGCEYLKWAVNKPRRVLYIDGEMPAVAMQERLHAIAGLEQVPENLSLLSADLYENGLPDLASPAGQAAIERVLGDAEVVVFDNVSTLFRAGIENEAESWLPVQNWLLRLRRKGKTVIVIHHAGKGKAQRGTSRREDVLDLVLNLRAPDDYDPTENARFEVHFEKGRGLIGDAKETFEAKLETRDGRAIWTTRDLADAKLADIRELRAAGRTLRQIATELGMSKSAVDRALTKAAESGQ